MRVSWVHTINCLSQSPCTYFRLTFRGDPFDFLCPSGSHFSPIASRLVPIAARPPNVELDALEGKEDSQAAPDQASEVKSQTTVSKPTVFLSLAINARIPHVHLQLGRGLKAIGQPGQIAVIADIRSIEFSSQQLPSLDRPAEGTDGACLSTSEATFGRASMIMLGPEDPDMEFPSNTNDFAEYNHDPQTHILHLTPNAEGSSSAVRVRQKDSDVKVQTGALKLTLDDADINSISYIVSPFLYMMRATTQPSPASSSTEALANHPDNAAEDVSFSHSDREWLTFEIASFDFYMHHEGQPFSRAGMKKVTGRMIDGSLQNQLLISLYDLYMDDTSPCGAIYPHFVRFRDDELIPDEQVHRRTVDITMYFPAKRPQQFTDELLELRSKLLSLELYKKDCSERPPRGDEGESMLFELPPDTPLKCRQAAALYLRASNLQVCFLQRTTMEVTNFFNQAFLPEINVFGKLPVHPYVHMEEVLVDVKLMPPVVAMPSLVEFDMDVGEGVRQLVSFAQEHPDDCLLDVRLDKELMLQVYELQSPLLQIPLTSKSPEMVVSTPRSILVTLNGPLAVTSSFMQSHRLRPTIRVHIDRFNMWLVKGGLDQTSSFSKKHRRGGKKGSKASIKYPLLDDFEWQKTFSRDLPQLLRDSNMIAFPCDMDVSINEHYMHDTTLEFFENTKVDEDGISSLPPPCMPILATLVEMDQFKLDCTPGDFERIMLLACHGLTEQPQINTRPYHEPPKVDLSKEEIFEFAGIKTLVNIQDCNITIYDPTHAGTAESGQPPRPDLFTSKSVFDHSRFRRTIEVWQDARLYADDVGFKGCPSLLPEETNSSHFLDLLPDLVLELRNQSISLIESAPSRATLPSKPKKRVLLAGASALPTQIRTRSHLSPVPASPSPSPASLPEENTIDAIEKNAGMGEMSNDKSAVSGSSGRSAEKLLACSRTDPQICRLRCDFSTHT